jgi:hypothetical protein
MRSAILVSIIPGLLAALAMVYAIGHIRRPTTGGRGPIRLRVRPVLDAGLGRLLAAVGAFEVGNVAATLLILRATDLLTPSMGSSPPPNWPWSSMPATTWLPPWPASRPGG